MRDKSTRSSTGHGTGALQELGLHARLERDRYLGWVKRVTRRAPKLIGRSEVRLNRSESPVGPRDPRGRSLSRPRSRGPKTALVLDWEKFMRATWPELFKDDDKAKPVAAPAAAETRREGRPSPAPACLPQRVASRVSRIFRRRSAA